MSIQTSDHQALNSTILLVDDDPAILEGVTDLLELYKYDVVTATDGQSALVEMESFTPSLIVSDIMMPDMDGYEFYEAVRNNTDWTTIPFIFLTARGQRADIQRGSRMGAEGYLVKPFEPEDLLAAVIGRLRRAEALKDAVRNDVEGMKQQLLTIFSHELRTPLTYIYGYVNILQDSRLENDVSSTTQEMLDYIQQGADRLVKLVEDLILMVRLDSGLVAHEIGTHAHLMSVRNMVTTAVSNFEQDALKNNITLEYDVPADLTIVAIESYLFDALMRLVDNAIKFTSPRGGGSVTISTRTSEDYVYIDVRDDGVGIDQQKLDAVRALFEQVGRKLLEQQGIGLGLPLVNLIVTGHGGEMLIETEPDVGSCFTLKLPFKAKPNIPEEV